MKKIYCIEEWCKESDSYSEKFRDGSWWGHMDEPWKIGCYDVVEEFEDEKEFHETLMNIINRGGTVGKVYIKEMPDDYQVSMKI